MKKIKISCSCMNDRKELVKALSFVSEKIININAIDDYIEIKVEEGQDIDEIKSKLAKVIDKYTSNSDLKETITFENKVEHKFINPIDVYNSNLVKNYGEGLICLKGDAVRLFKYFDNTFSQFALELGAEEVSYPVLLPLENLKKTGYLRNSPQYITLCCNPKEDIDVLMNLYKKDNENELLNNCSPPRFSLSPSACFHCYMDLENTTLEHSKILTLRQNVFRNEGRLNWYDFGRLRDYNVREIVFFGDSEFVTKSRNNILEKVKDFIVELGIDSRICITHDPFVVPSMQKFKKIQIMEASKYELQLRYDENKYMAVGSFNIHGDAFTNPFNIKIKDYSDPVTGCIGFGLERFVLAYITQFGVDSNYWSKEIIDKINKME